MQSFQIPVNFLLKEVPRLREVIHFKKYSKIFQKNVQNTKVLKVRFFYNGEAAQMLPNFTSNEV